MSEVRPCREVEEKLVELLYDELPSAEAAALRAQLAECPEAAERLREWQALRAAADEIAAPAPDRSVHYDILRAARAEVGASTEKRPWWAIFELLTAAPAFGAIAVVVLVAGTSFYLTMEQGEDALIATQSPAIAEATGKAGDETLALAPAAKDVAVPGAGMSLSGAPPKSAEAPEATAEIPEREAAVVEAPVAELEKLQRARSGKKAEPQPVIAADAPTERASPRRVARPRTSPKAKPKSVQKPSVRRGENKPTKAAPVKLPALGKRQKMRSAGLGDSFDEGSAVGELKEGAIDSRGGAKRRATATKKAARFAPPPPAPDPAAAPVAVPEPMVPANTRRPADEPLSAAETFAQGAADLDTLDDFALDASGRSQGAESGPSASGREGRPSGSVGNAAAELEDLADDEAREEVAPASSTAVAQTRRREDTEQARDKNNKQLAAEVDTSAAETRRLDLAREASRRGRLREAVGHYRQFVDGYRGHPQWRAAAFELAEVHRRLGNHREARVWYKRVASGGDTYATRANIALTTLGAETPEPQFDAAEQAEPPQAAPSALE